jgi:serine/threonine protein kinase
MLGSPGGMAPPGATALPGEVINTDDAPTVITNTRSPSPPPPLPLTVTGDAPSITGRRLGHYELIEAIGAGGMAAVLKARDLELGRIVALKILPPESARDQESVNRFKQEARAAAMLDHENVARVYSCGEDQGLHFIAFEFVEGDNLRVLIDRRGTIPAAECVRYMIQVAAGLNHAAERGVVHRDIKPSNIIITPDGRAKIVDMGLARHLDSLSVNGGVTQSGVTLGTFDYISPEQALDPRRADVRSDIYSLGCSFYHALTGRPPVPEGTAAKKLHAHQHIEPLDPRVLDPRIPDEVAVVLSGMMAKNPDRRYQSPTELIAHLKGLIERLKLGSDGLPTDSAVQAVPANPSVLPEAPRLRFGWVLGIAAVAITIAAFAMSGGDRRPQQSSPFWAADPPGKTTTSVTPLAETPVPPSNVAADGVRTVETVDDLADELSKKRSKVQLAKGTFDLRKRPAAIEFTGDKLELLGSRSGGSTIILPIGTQSTAASHRGLSFRVKSLVMRGIRFEFRPDTSQDSAEVGPGAPGLAIHASGGVELTDCFFSLQSGQAEDAVGVAIASSLASTADAPTLDVRIARCAFGNESSHHGCIALQVPARCKLQVEDSGFGPHNAAIQVVPPRDEVLEQPGLAIVKLERSSFMLDPRSAAVSAESLIELSAWYCVFAALGSAQDRPPQNPYGTVLHALRRETIKSFSGQGGKKNVYYGVNPLVIGTGENARSFTLEQCRAESLIGGEKAVTLNQRPWDDRDPLATLAKDPPWPAFRLKLTDPALFVDDSYVIVGAQFYDRTNEFTPYYTSPLAYPGLVWPPPKPRTAAEVSQKIWDPTTQDLGQLLRTVRPDDVILIKHDGLVPLESTVVLQSRTTTDFRVTFKPAPGCKPVFQAPGGGILKQYLFQLMSGEVAFEGIQFLLKPSHPRNPQWVTAVSIVGGKACTFTDCVFTLAEEDEARASAVLLDDPEKIMAMDGTSRPVPEVKFDRCILRGKGRGIWVPASRAVRVSLNQTLSAIDGSLLISEHAGKSVPGARSTLKLTRVTALIGGPLVELKGGKVGEMRLSGLVPVEVHSDDCLFAAVPGAGQPLVALEGIDSADVKSVLEWQVQNANRYANFDAGATMVTIRPTEDGVPKEWDWNQWTSFSGEPPAAGKPVGKITFALPPAGLKELARVKPDDVRIKMADFPDLASGIKAEDAGAVWNTLPQPWPGEAAVPEESRPE